MSAPVTAYHTEQFHETDTVVVSSYPIAKYFNSDAFLKSRFYLDWLYRIGEGENTQWGFIGGCDVGSENSLMHKRSFSTLKGLTERYYSDAGLNTLSFIEAILNSPEGSSIDVYVLTSYFSQSDVVRLYWRLEGSSGAYNEIINNSLISHPINEPPRVVSFDAGNNSIPTGVLLEVYAEIENYEGIYKSDTVIISVESHSVDITINFKSLNTIGTVAQGEIEITMSVADKAKIGIGGDAVWYVKFSAIIGVFEGDVLDDNDGAMDLDVYSYYVFNVTLNWYDPNISGSYYLALTDLPSIVNGYNVNWNIINPGREGTVSMNFDNTFELRKSIYGTNTWYMYAYNYDWVEAGGIIPTFNFAMYDGTTFIDNRIVGCYFFTEDYNFPVLGYGDVAEQFTYLRSIGDIPSNVNRVVLLSYNEGLPVGYNYNVNSSQFNF